MSHEEEQGQLPGLPAPGRRRAAFSSASRSKQAGARVGAAAAPTSPELPVARVAVLTPLPHLDRPFDYSVPEAIAAAVQPGVRVRVRLAGRLVDGYVIDRVDAPESERVLRPIKSVHGPPVLTPAVARLCREVADRYAGTFADVVRAAVPPRHARAETRVIAQLADSSSGTGAGFGEHAAGPAAGSSALSRGGAGVGGTGDRARAEEIAGSAERVRGAERAGMAQPSRSVESAGSAASAGGAQGAVSADRARAAWQPYQGGAQLVADLAAGSTVRVSWLSGPGENLPVRVAELCALTTARGRGALVIAPDAGDVDDLVKAMKASGVPCINLTAASGPEARYRAFLLVLTGHAQVVVGTRGAVFAPVADLGLVVVLHDADDSLVELHAPGWHAREVAALRALDPDVSVVLAGPSVSLEAERMVAVGWLTPVGLPRTTLRARMPHVQTADQAAHGDPARASSRIPSVVLELLRGAAAVGPVLVSVPRAGYLPFLVCDRCRVQATCPQCGDPLLAHDAARIPTCPTHGPVPAWRCSQCGGERTRAGVVGMRRTAEEFGRALPGLPVIASSAERGVVRRLPTEHGIVVATPGAEPHPGPQGYAALVLLDVAAALSRPGMRVAEEVLRRWFLIASLVRPAAAGGRVLVVGAEGLREVQALVRWDPRGYARRELDERLALALPPAVRTARLTGPADDVAEIVEHVRSELAARVRRASGPLPPDGRAEEGEDGSDRATWVLGVSPADGPRLTAVLQQVQAMRSVRKRPVVRVRLDPVAP